ncbi:MAG: hypothetical protein HWN66_19170 [Candidatus Helarchaeota archaeon]|nr:hypothetical protein [Candidatus Helarchaeota archaeon]
MAELGRNVLYKIENDRLFLEIDLKAEKTPSKSGKSLIIASTHGNKRIFQDQEIFLGLNLYERVQQKKEE